VVCQYCGREIGAIHSLRDNEFCSTAHRKRYREKLGQALCMVAESDPISTSMAGFFLRYSPQGVDPALAEWRRLNGIPRRELALPSNWLASVAVVLEDLTDPAEGTAPPAPPECSPEYAAPAAASDQPETQEDPAEGIPAIEALAEHFSQPAPSHPDPVAAAAPVAFAVPDSARLAEPGFGILLPARGGAPETAAAALLQPRAKDSATRCSFQGVLAPEPVSEGAVALPGIAIDSPPCSPAVNGELAAVPLRAADSNVGPRMSGPAPQAVAAPAIPPAALGRGGENAAGCAPPECGRSVPIPLQAEDAVSTHSSTGGIPTSASPQTGALVLPRLESEALPCAPATSPALTVAAPPAAAESTLGPRMSGPEPQAIAPPAMSLARVEDAAPASVDDVQPRCAAPHSVGPKADDAASTKSSTAGVPVLASRQAGSLALPRFESETQQCVPAASGEMAAVVPLPARGLNGQLRMSGPAPQSIAPPAMSFASLAEATQAALEAAPAECAGSRALAPRAEDAASTRSTTGGIPAPASPQAAALALPRFEANTQPCAPAAIGDLPAELLMRAAGLKKGREQAGPTPQFSAAPPPARTDPPQSAPPTPAAEAGEESYPLARIIPLEYYSQRVRGAAIVAPAPIESRHGAEAPAFRMEPAFDRPRERTGATAGSKKGPAAVVAMPAPGQKIEKGSNRRRLLLNIAACLLVCGVLWGVSGLLRPGSRPELAGATAPGASAGSPGGAAMLRSGPAGLAASQPQTAMGRFRKALAQRASVEVTDNFEKGMEAWGATAKTWAAGWTKHPDGYVRPGQLALFQPSLKFDNYRMEFFTQIESKGVSWVVRAKDKKNYHAMKFTVIESGLRPVIAMVHYPVADGKPGKRSEIPLSVMIHNNESYHVAVTVKGNRVVTSIGGQEVDSWSEGAPGPGGVGFFADAGERARLYWMKVAANDDFLGRVCAYVSGALGEDGQTAKRWDMGRSGSPVAPGETALAAALFLGN
jgi:hypothetical protein